MWWKQRRPEIVEDFDREVYGRVPKETPKVKWEVTGRPRSRRSATSPVVTKRLVGHVDNSAYPQITVDIQLTLTTPANAAGPVPVMMEFGFVLRRQGGRQGRRRRRQGRPVAGSSRCSRRAGATRSSSRTASRPTTAAG